MSTPIYIKMDAPCRVIATLRRSVEATWNDHLLSKVQSSRTARCDHLKEGNSCIVPTVSVGLLQDESDSRCMYTIELY